MRLIGLRLISLLYHGQSGRHALLHEIRLTRVVSGPCVNVGDDAIPRPTPHTLQILNISELVMRSIPTLDRAILITEDVANGDLRSYLRSTAAFPPSLIDHLRMVRLSHISVLSDPSLRSALTLPVASCTSRAAPLCTAG